MVVDLLVGEPWTGALEPLNNPDTVSAEQATHLKESDLALSSSLEHVVNDI